jgi:integrase
MIDFDAFGQWLTEQGYQPTTITSSLRDARHLCGRLEEGGELHPRLRTVAFRISHFLKETAGPGLGGAERLSEALGQLQAESPVGRLKRRRGRRQRVARSLSDPDWRTLCGTIRADESPEARVLDVMASTGLRVGDVLRLSRRRLGEGLRTGRVLMIVKGGDERELHVAGAPDAWTGLGEAFEGTGAPTVARLVSPEGNGDPEAGGAAYKRLARKLHELTAEAGIAERVNLHRLRRTVGVQALRLTEDVPAVAQLLGHRSTATTMGYLDEARPERVAELQRKVAERFSDDEE